MVRTPRARIRRYAVAMLICTLAIWLVAGWTVHGQVELQREASKGQAERLAVFFERQVLSIFRYGDAYLKVIRREYVENRDLDRLSALLGSAPLDRALVSHVTYIDETATPRFNSAYPLKPGVTVGDRAYFLHHADRDDDDLYVALPSRGRNSGKLIVRLVRRVTFPDGQFGGVMFVALDVGSITEFFSAMHLGPSSSATLVGLDKKIRARSSYGRLGPGQDISGSRLWRELERNPVGTYVQTSVVDDVTRTYAYRQIPEFPLVVAIGVADEDVRRGIVAYRTQAYLVAALLTILIGSMTMLISREVLAGQRIAESESRVRAMRDELAQRVETRTEELVEAQRELLRKERLAALGELTGTVAHELRNPLTTITTSIAVLDRRLEAPSANVAAPMARIRRNVERCNGIITELLDFTRARGADRRPTDLDPWVEEVIGEMPARDGVTLEVAPGAPGEVVALDPDRLRRALVNLVDNAADAISGAPDPHGTVRISTRIRGDRVEIEVTDDGPGMPGAVLAQVLEPLFSTKSFGVGLGLPVVQRVMEEHGGGLDLQSTEGEGTRATLWLARAHEEPAA